MPSRKSPRAAPRQGGKRRVRFDADRSGAGARDRAGPSDQRGLRLEDRKTCGNSPAARAALDEDADCSRCDPLLAGRKCGFSPPRPTSAPYRITPSLSTAKWGSCGKNRGAGAVLRTLRDDRGGRGRERCRATSSRDGKFFGGSSDEAVGRFDVIDRTTRPLRATDAVHESRAIEFGGRGPFVDDGVGGTAIAAGAGAAVAALAPWAAVPAFAEASSGVGIGSCIAAVRRTARGAWLSLAADASFAAIAARSEEHTSEPVTVKSRMPSSA